MTEIDLSRAYDLATISKELPDDIKKLFESPSEIPHPFKSAYAHQQYLRQVATREQNIRDRGNSVFPRDSRFP